MWWIHEAQSRNKSHHLVSVRRRRADFNYRVHARLLRLNPLGAEGRTPEQALDNAAPKVMEVMKRGGYLKT